jgi:hypothetical protein
MLLQSRNRSEGKVGAEDLRGARRKFSWIGHSSLRRLAWHNKTVLFAPSARILRGSRNRGAAEDAWNDISFGQIFLTRAISAA